MSISKPDLIKLLGDDHGLIAYRKSLVKVAGSITAAILLSRIIFWWVRQNRKPFYKFKAPPNKGNEKYREGDSWLEELSFTQCEFDGALKRIGKKSRKGSKLDESSIVWYWTDSNNVTWYRVNEQRLVSILMEMGNSEIGNDTPHIKPKSSNSDVGSGDIDVDKSSSISTHNDHNDTRASDEVSSVLEETIELLGVITTRRALAEWVFDSTENVMSPSRLIRTLIGLAERGLSFRGKIIVGDKAAALDKVLAIDEWYDEMSLQSKKADDAVNDDEALVRQEQEQRAEVALIKKVSLALEEGRCVLFDNQNSSPSMRWKGRIENVEGGFVFAGEIKHHICAGEISIQGEIINRE